MLVLGGIALFGIRKNSWLVLLVVECANAALLLLIIVRNRFFSASRGRPDGRTTLTRAARRSALFWASCSAQATATTQVRWHASALAGLVCAIALRSHPVSRALCAVQAAMDKSFDEPTFARSLWEGEYCLRQEPALCNDDFAPKANSAISNVAFSTFDSSATVSTVFANCTKAAEQASIIEAEALRVSCVRCKNKCRHWMVLDLKQYLKPATAVVFCVLVFVIMTIVVNDMLVSDLNRWVFGPLLGYVMCDEFGEASFLRCNVYGLNALTGAAGIALTVASFMGDAELAERCPEGGDCSNPVVTAVGVIGIGLALLGIATIVCINLPMATVGKLAVRAINFGYAGLGFILLVCGVFVTIISGGVESMQSATDDNFPEIRQQYETQDPDYCIKDRRPMTDEECRAKVLEDMESMVFYLALFAFFLACGMVAVMYVTLRAIKMMKGTTLVEKVIDNVVPVRTTCTSASIGARGALAGAVTRTQLQPLHSAERPLNECDLLISSCNPTCRPVHHLLTDFAIGCLSGRGCCQEHLPT